MFRESKAFIDLLAKQEDGCTYWLLACRESRFLDPDVLQRLIDTGADIAEVDNFGWNCLFQCVAFACFPGSAKEFKALRSLLAVFDDIRATDLLGIDIFSYVNEQEEWPILLDPDDGSYGQDLWYCALKRSGLDARYDIAPCARIARYTSSYTPKHYLALCHLDFWNSDDFDSQVDLLLLEYPMTEEEMETTKRLEEGDWTEEGSDTNSTAVSEHESGTESKSASESESSDGSWTAGEGDHM